MTLAHDLFKGNTNHICDKEDNVQKTRSLSNAISFKIFLSK